MTDKILHALTVPTPELGFGQYYAPKMLFAKYEKGAWGPLKLQDTQPLSLHPGARVLHYAQEIFEGLKAFRAKNGIHLFRPHDNIRRMSLSAEILAMPAFAESAFLEGLQTLVRESEKLIPGEPGALYLRPTMIGTSTTLGVAAATEYEFFVLASPVGGYFGKLPPGQPASISLWISPSHVRAFRGGVGKAKTGANYAASLRGITEGRKLGFNNTLFLDGVSQRFVEELGGMNFLIVEDGVLKTSPLGDTILNGVTRNTLMKLAELEKIPVREEAIDVNEMIAGIRAGRITEAFACGTGASVSSIRELGWKGEKIAVEQASGPGKITCLLYKKLVDIQFGRSEAPVPAWCLRC